jgi:hypothetical protein
MKYSIALIALAVTPLALDAQGAHPDHAGSVRAAVRPSLDRAGIRRDGIRTITVTASDYAFAAPDSVSAGLTEIRLENRGTEMHHVLLIRLDGGKTISDLFATMKGAGPLPSWAREVGGPNTPVPGGESTAMVRLSAGRYAMICVIPSADGTPHVMKGMAKEVVVTPALSNTANANVRVSSTMTLVDYAFQFSQPLQAGRQTIRVKNDAAQPHEVLVVRLQPGKKMMDVLAWMQKMEGPPPGAPIGGTTPMAHGEENLITMDLTPGEYGLVCFAPDAKDGKPHIEHGMITQFTVTATR